MDSGGQSAPDVPGLSELGDLRRELDAILVDPAFSDATAHRKRLTLACAIISEAFRRCGMLATLVGGGAIEFHAPGVYVTDDADLVVEARSGGPNRQRLHEVFGALGFAASGRHWVRDGFFVEVPSSYLEDPFNEIPVGPYVLRVVKKEVVLVGRLVEFDQTGHTGHGAQAVTMMRAFAGEMDRPLLDRLLRRERAGKVHAALRELAASDQRITDEVLRDTWDRLRGRAWNAASHDPSEE